MRKLTAAATSKAYTGSIQTVMSGARQSAKPVRSRVTRAPT
jgi:hypothetical protein